MKGKKRRRIHSSSVKGFYHPWNLKHFPFFLSWIKKRNQTHDKKRLHSIITIFCEYFFSLFNFSPRTLSSISIKTFIHYITSCVGGDSLGSGYCCWCCYCCFRCCWYCWLLLLASHSLSMIQYHHQLVILSLEQIFLYLKKKEWILPFS